LDDEIQIGPSLPKIGVDHMAMVFHNPLHGCDGAGFNGRGEVGISDAQDNDEEGEGDKDHTAQDEPLHPRVFLLPMFGHRPSPPVEEMAISMPNNTKETASFNRLIFFN
jgi:hypothetical protein